jgi:hypothetical protein
MKKQELLDELEQKDFCGKILGTTEVQLTEDDLKVANSVKWYHIHFMEIVGKVAKCKKISMYVFDEGTAKESAYYGEREPEKSINITPIA